jgi:hypothetical protein
MGITNMLAAVPGFVGPIFVGWITNDNVRVYLKFLLILSFFFVCIANISSMEINIYCLSKRVSIWLFCLLYFI